MFFRLTVLPPSLSLITSLFDMCSLSRGGEGGTRGWGSLSAGLGEIKDRFTWASVGPGQPSLTVFTVLESVFNSVFAEPLKIHLIFYTINELIA